MLKMLDNDDKAKHYWKKTKSLMIDILIKWKMAMRFKGPNPGRSKKIMSY